MNNTNNVGEIFTAAGAAFNKLAELTMQLHPLADTASGLTWSFEDIELLESAYSRFSKHLDHIKIIVDNRGVSENRVPVEEPVFEEVVIPVRQLMVNHRVLGTGSELTLNMLNAPDSEIEIIDLEEGLPLEYGSTPDEI